MYIVMHIFIFVKKRLCLKKKYYICIFNENAFFNDET